MTNKSYINQSFRNRVVHYKSARASLSAYARTGMEAFERQSWMHLLQWIGDWE